MFKLFLRSLQTILQLKSILEILYDATVAVQRKDLTLSDGYQIWLSTSLGLADLRSSEEQRTNLVVTLLAEMKDRESDLFEYDAAVSASYLDPRFTSSLSLEKKQQAKSFIFKVWRRVLRMRKQGALFQSESQSSALRSQQLVERFLSLTEQSSVTADEGEEDFIREKLRQFQIEPRESCLGFSIHEYWKKIVHHRNILKKFLAEKH